MLNLSKQIDEHQTNVTNAVLQPKSRQKWPEEKTKHKPRSSSLNYCIGVVTNNTSTCVEDLPPCLKGHMTISCNIHRLAEKMCFIHHRSSNLLSHKPAGHQRHHLDCWKIQRFTATYVEKEADISKPMTSRKHKDFCPSAAPAGVKYSMPSAIWMQNACFFLVFFCIFHASRKFRVSESTILFFPIPHLEQ